MVRESKWTLPPYGHYSRNNDVAWPRFMERRLFAIV
jgi:hypothetical protein